LPDRLQALGESLGQLRMVGPTLDKVHFDGAGSRGKGGAAIEPNAGAGVLRCKTDNDCRGNAVLTHLAHHVDDVRLPVAHARIDRQAKRLGKQSSLFQGELRERAGANKTVAVANLGDDRFGHGPPGGDIAQVLGYLVERLGRSVSKQQDGRLRHVSFLPARR
jgi:hypothetical protein